MNLHLSGCTLGGGGAWKDRSQDHEKVRVCNRQRPSHQPLFVDVIMLLQRTPAEGTCGGFFERHLEGAGRKEAESALTVEEQEELWAQDGS